MKKNLFWKQSAVCIFSLLFWILLWFFLAKKVDLSFILPGPVEVFRRLWELAREASFYQILFSSFLRVISGFLFGVFLGFLLGFLAHRLTPVRSLISPLMAIIRATPVASFILVVILWLERGEVPGFISFLMVLPILWQNTLLGFSSLDPALEEMAKVFRLGHFCKFFRLDLPQVIPYVLSSGKAALGLAWKAGVAAEVLALPKVSIGKMISDAKLYLETVDLYAWTVAIILLSVFLEKLFWHLLPGGKGESRA